MTAVAAAPVRRAGWAWVRPAVAAATLAALVWRLGTGPFLDGLRAVDLQALAAACVLAAITTVCCAWRWRVVARGLGDEIPMRTAVAAYYRSIFVNIALPGGVVGDVDRGFAHGFRPVVWERAAGQAVQAVLTVAVLLALPSPLSPAMPFVAIALLAAAVAIAAGARGRLRHLLARRALPAIALASALVVAGHAATFLIAAHAAGADAPLSRLVPITLIVLAGAALPNVGGWGPREGVTAWAFGAAGLGASVGVAAAVVYGVMVLVAGLPGAAVILAGRVRDA